MAANLSQETSGDRLWQVNCYLFRPAVSITLKSKIRYNGQEYSSPAQLPPEIRMAYEKALHQKAIKMNFVINGEKFGTEAEMPADVRKLCDDVMSAIESNGEVTIPNKTVEPWLSKKEIVVVAVFTGGVIAMALARLVLG